MATIHPEPKLVYLSPDGDGGWDVRIVLKDGSLYVHPLDLKRVLQWSETLTKILHEQLKDRLEISTFNALGKKS